MEEIILSNVEKICLSKSGRTSCKYIGENIPTLEVQNIYELGRLVALRFIEWVIENPTGVVALPTGRTPEFFIKTLAHLKENWSEPSIQQGINESGIIGCDSFPDMSGLTFVMLDEFFPMLPTHRNSFCNYIEMFYTSVMGIQRENIYKFDLIAQNIVSLEELEDFSKIDVDLTLLTRDGINEDELRRKNVLERVQQFCDDFETKIRSIGGIGFFLGGIGPDGHIAFNQEGCAHDTKTRLVGFNYATAAAAAGDLGGIEISRGKAAMTIGLETITYNKNATIIIMAAGEGKAEVVRAGIEDPIDNARPSSVLQNCKGGRFYVTHGAANKLTARKCESVSNINADVLNWAMEHCAGTTSPSLECAHMVVPPEDYMLAESVVYQLSLKSLKPVHLLSVDDIKCLTKVEQESLPVWFTNPMSFKVFASCASRRLREKVEGGLRQMSVTGKSILHTAPHHDDIMLSYHAAMHELLGRQPGGRSAAEDGSAEIIREMEMIKPTKACHIHKKLGEVFNNNFNHFAYLTSGFHSVNDSFLQAQVQAIRGDDGEFNFLHDAVWNGEITRNYDDLMHQFYNSFFRKDFATQDRIEHIIFLRKVVEVYNVTITISYSLLEQKLKECIKRLCEEYLDVHQPGDAIPKNMQILKGCMRESEVDRVWALSKMPMNRIHHLRSKFYNDDFFTPMPSLTEDALPMANLIRDQQPEIISVAFDPEGTGPDTHYKVLQLVAAGLRISLDKGDLTNRNPTIWGYRNVWFVFTPSDTTLMIPGGAEDLDLMHNTFMSCFTTQKAASYPSPHYDGPFSAWARHLQFEQKKELLCLLGEDYFNSHSDPRVRNSAGFIYLKAMYADRFLKEVEELKSKFEIVKN